MLMDDRPPHDPGDAADLNIMGYLNTNYKNGTNYIGYNRSKTAINQVLWLSPVQMRNRKYDSYW